MIWHFSSPQVLNMLRLRLLSVLLNIPILLYCGYFQTENDSLLIGKIDDLNSAAFYAGKGSDLQKKRQLLAQVIQICKQNDLEDDGCAYAFQHQGGIYYRLGDYDLAKENYESSIKICRRIEENDTLSSQLNNILSRALLDLASLSREFGHPDRMITTYQELLKKAPPLAVKFLIKGNIGQAIAESGELQEGIDSLLKIDLDHPSVSGNLKAGTYKVLARSFALMKKYALAEYYYEEARKATKTTFGIQSRELGKLSNSYASDFLLAQGKYRAGAKQFQQTLTQLLPNFLPRQLLENPSPEIMGSENTVLEALQGKAQALMQLSAHVPHKIEYLESALECFDLIALVENQLRRTYFFDNAKLNLQAGSHERMELGLSLAYQLYLLDPAPKYIYAALNLVENHKALFLLEALNELENQAILSKNPFFLALKKLQERIKFNELNLQELQRRPDSLRVQAIESEEDSLRNELQNLLAEIEISYPEYYEQKYQPVKIDSIQIIEYLETNPQGTLVEYFWGQNKCFTIGISAKGYLFSSIETKKIGNEKIESFLNNIRHRKNVKMYKELAFGLYENLWLPLEESKILTERVTIIPDGTLALLPFDALLSSPVDGNKAKNFPYLFRKHVLNYGFSLSVLLKNLSLSSRNSQSVKPYLGIAPVQYQHLNSSITLDELPGSEDQINLGKRLFKGRRLTYAKASIAKFKSIVGQYDLIHFSTHASANDSLHTFPWISFSDSLLFLPEIYMLDLKASHIILSSCEASQGRLQAGEGVFSLARGFSFSGCPSITSTLWQVRQESTSKIISEYLSNLRRGLDKDIALHEAKTSYLDEALHSAAHPFFWSGIVTVGDTAPVKQTSNSPWQKIFAFSLPLLILLFLLGKRFFFYKT